MLTLYHDGRQIPLLNTDYYIRELASGFDEIIFSLSIYDPIYALIQEEEQIVDRGGQRYLVKQIDAGAEWAKIICILDLDDWKADMWLNFDSDTATVAQTVQMVLPEGWSIVDRSGVLISRTIRGNYTSLKVCDECRDVFHVYFRWDTVERTITILSQEMGAPVGAFASRQLNLKEIQYKGKSNDFATRLYAYGKEDEDTGLPLTIRGAMVDGEPYPYEYIENRSYADKLISVYWSDERYTVKENLYADAVNKLAQLAVPERSYSCAIVDLQSTNPELYRNMDFGLFVTATLIDDIKGTAVNYQVVERHIYPYHPEQNEVVFDHSPQKITTSVTRVAEIVENPNSSFNQIINEKVINATNWITSADGYVVARKDSNGTWKELLFLDTPDLATARNILRINTNGIGFSHNGLNGPYTNAWTIDGNLVADFITTGTLTATIIKAGILSDLAGVNYWNLETGDFRLVGDVEMQDGSGVLSSRLRLTAVEWLLNRFGYGFAPSGVNITANDTTNDMYGWFFIPIDSMMYSHTRQTNQTYSEIIRHVVEGANNPAVHIERVGTYLSRVWASYAENSSAVANVLTYGSGYLLYKIGQNLDTMYNYPSDPTASDAGANMEFGLSVRPSVGTGYNRFLAKVNQNMYLYLTDTMFRAYVSASITLLLNSNGLFINGSYITPASTSSRRYKHSIEPIKESNLDPHRLLDLQAVQFIYNYDHKPQYPDMAGETIPGFIAEDVAEVYPAAVIHDADGQIESWDERRIIPGMLALIQEQETRIERLEKLVAKLMEGADIGC